MDALAAGIRTIVEGILTPFDWLGAFWGLTVFSLLSGVGMLWIVGKTTPQHRVEVARNQMASAIYEIRLFLDSPKRVLISLGRLLSSSFLYVGWMLPAFVVLALPLGVAFLHLEARHGMDPLPLGEPFVVTVDLADGVDGRTLKVRSSADLEVTAPPVVIGQEDRVALRVVAKTIGTLSLQLEVDGSTVEKTIVTDPDAVQMAPQRASGSDLWFAYGSEDRLSEGPVAGIAVDHPARETRYLGIDMPWWLYWMILSMVAAFALRKPMNVAI